MGVDWVPCRVEAGVTREELDELVRREADHFRASGNSFAALLDPRIQFSDAEQAEIRRAYTELGPLHQHLLFKQTSHRINVIIQQPLFPIEWRIDAERTFLPWELSSQLSTWEKYRDDVARGFHQAFLQQLCIYVQIRDLVSVELANLTSIAKDSAIATGKWATSPEVEACRNKILGEKIVDLPRPPRFPEGDAEMDFTVVEHAFVRVADVIGCWNAAVQRGNKRARPPRRRLSFDEWVAENLRDKWFASFLEWVEPWKQGGYGLYRDCE